MKWKQGLPTYTPEPLWDYSWFHQLLKILLHNWASPRQQSLWIRPWHSNCCVLPFLRKHLNLENQTAQHYINVLKNCYRKSIIFWKCQCSWVWHLRTCSDTTFSKLHFRRKPGNILHINTLSMLPYQSIYIYHFWTNTLCLLKGSRPQRIKNKFLATISWQFPFNCRLYQLKCKQ